MNLMQIKNKTSLIEQKTQQLINDIKRMDFKNETEMYHYLFSSLREYYLKLGKPTLQVRPAWGPPISSDFNKTMHEAQNDINTLYTEANTMTKAVGDLYQQVTLDRSFLSNKLKGLEDKLKKIDMKLNAKTHQVAFHESFINQDNYETKMVSNSTSPAKVHAGVGILTLDVKNSNVVSSATIKMLPGSNGFPGNTHQVKVVSNKIKFFGEDNLHMNLAEIMDGNADTWLEYELYSIADSVKQQLFDLGFEYSERVSWIKDDDDSLWLILDIELPTAKTLNFLALTPYLPNQKGAIPAVIDELIVSDGKGDSITLCQNTKFNEDKVFMFGKIEAKTIRMMLKQNMAYETEIGHLYYKELTKTPISWLSKDKEQAGKRIDGTNPSITNLGFKYDPKVTETNGVVYPSVSLGYKIPNQAKVIKNLFSVPTVKERNIQAGIEVIRANRYHIGIRDCQAASYNFVTTSDYISKKFHSDQPIKSIAVKARHEIPDKFGAGNFVQYFISVDEGKTWNEIYPEGTTTGKTIYLFNSNIPDEGRDSRIGYIDTLKPIQDVRLKISLSRPTDIQDADYYSPVVYEYALKVTVEGGVK